MPDPIQVEKLFQEMMAHFESSLSIRHRYRLFRYFMECLEGSFKRYESYIIQIVDILPEYGGPITWSGIDPEEIEIDLDLLEELERLLELSNKSENFQRIKNQLGEICLLLYAFLNEKNEVDDHLKKLFGIKGLNKPDQAVDSEILDLLAQKISEEIYKREGGNGRHLARLRRISEQIRKIQTPEKWKALIPVAEIYVKNELKSNEYGRLRKIFVDLYKETADYDELIWNTNIYGALNPMFEHNKRPLGAARNLLESATRQKVKIYYRGGISFDLSTAIHDGESANLAIAALWYTRLLEASNQRERYYINSQTAITGDVDKQGNVDPVDYESIALKTRAAFFSWANILVVPFKQRNAFENELIKLTEKYPARNLKLIGVSHLKEIFFDRRATSHVVESRFRFYYNKTKSLKNSMVSVPMIIILLVIIGWLILGPVDQNPVDAEYRGEQMLLKNQFGQTIQSIDVGAMLIQDLNQARNEYTRNKAAFIDINYDGINEVIYSRNFNNENESKDEELVAYSVLGDSLIWTKQLRFDLQFPNKPFIDEDPFRVFNIHAIEDSAKVSHQIVANVSHNNFFPSLLLNLDAATGTEIGSYVHTGRINQILTYDLTEDGKDEIIGIGTNNAFDQAAVAFFLRSDDINGHSPLTEEYKIDGYQKANEIKYIRLPRSIVGDAFRMREMNNVSGQIQIDEEEKTILLRVYDFILRGENPFLNDSAGLLFYFNYDFEIQSIATDSNYDLWAKNLYEDGRIPFEPDHKYFESFKDSILYWVEDEFVFRSYMD